MTVLQQDNCHDTDGTELRSHFPGVGGWYSGGTPGNMYAQVNGNRITGSTDYRQSDIAFWGQIAHYYATTPLPTALDIKGTVYVASVLGTQNEIGFTYWDRDPYGWNRIVYKMQDQTWYLDRNEGGGLNYTGNEDQSGPTTVLDSYAQTLRAGQSVGVLIQIRDADVTVSLNGVQRLHTTDMYHNPVSSWPLPDGSGGFEPGLAPGVSQCGLWLWGGTATTGLQLSSYEIDSLPPPSIPQGATQTIPASGGDCPTISDRLYWDVLNPSGAVIATPDAPAGWDVTAPNTTHLTVTVPADAPVAAGYESRFNPNRTDPCVSAGFDVTPAGGGSGGGGGGGSPAPRRRRVCGC